MHSNDDLPQLNANNQLHLTLLSRQIKRWIMGIIIFIQFKDNQHHPNTSLLTHTHTETEPAVTWEMSCISLQLWTVFSQSTQMSQTLDPLSELDEEESAI